MSTQRTSREAHGLADSLWLPLISIGLLATPALFLSYLPMTDLPQHLSVASILLNLHDPRFGFSDYYVPDQNPLVRFLGYATQYGIVLSLAELVSLERAMRVFIFLSLVACPLGVLAVLRALNKPALLSLLALPLVYNRAFFWGFSSFNLSVGIALLAIALLIRARPNVASELALAALSLAVVFTHIYGLVLLLGYPFLWFCIGDRRRLGRRLIPLAPAAVGLLAWIWLWRDIPRLGQNEFLSAGMCFQLLPASVLGGYRDWSETLLLIAFSSVFLLLSFRALPLSRRRWRALRPHERILYAYLVLNVLLYFGLPMNTPTTTLVHFRHAILAALFLPMVACEAPLRKCPRLGGALLGALAAVTLFNSGVHLLRFDREARAFDEVIEHIPERPRVLALIWDRDGEVMRTAPYLHFAAYIQAEKGGLISASFPRIFWNIPVRLRGDVGIPKLPNGFEWAPSAFDYRRFGYYYDFVLVRPAKREADILSTTRAFPYELVHEARGWQLYRHARR